MQNKCRSRSLARSFSRNFLIYVLSDVLFVVYLPTRSVSRLYNANGRYVNVNPIIGGTVSARVNGSSRVPVPFSLADVPHRQL
jgi:hypothetical protein